MQTATATMRMTMRMTMRRSMMKATRGPVTPVLPLTAPASGRAFHSGLHTRFNTRMKRQHQQQQHQQQQQEEEDPSSLQQREIIASVQQFVRGQDIPALVAESAKAIRHEQQQQQEQTTEAPPAGAGAGESALTEDQVSQVREYVEHLLVIASNMFHMAPTAPSDGERDKAAAEGDVSNHVSQFFNILLKHVPLLRNTLVALPAQQPAEQQIMTSALVDTVLRILQAYETLDKDTSMFCIGVFMWGYTNGTEGMVEQMYRSVAGNESGTATPVHRALAYNELSGVFVRMNRREEAKEMLDAALDVMPLCISYLNRAALLPVEDLEGKLQEVKHAMELETQSSMPLVFRASVYRAHNRFDEALADLDMALNLDRHNPQVFLERMMLLTNHMAPQGLAQAMDDWTAICYLLTDLSTISESIKGVKGAITNEEWREPLVELMQSIAALTPLTTSSAQQLTQDQVKQCVETAMGHANRAIELKDTFAAAYRSRAFLLANILKQSKEGLENLTKAISLDENMHQAYTERSAILMYDLEGQEKVEIDGKEHDRMVLVREDLKKALALNEHSPDALLNAAMAELMSGDMEAALPAFDRYIAISPMNYAAYINRGIVKRALKQFEEAVTDFSTAIQLRPDQANAYALRAKTLSEDLKRPEEAEKDVKTISALQSAKLSQQKQHMQQQQQQQPESPAEEDKPTEESKSE